MMSYRWVGVTMLVVVVMMVGGAEGECQWVSWVNSDCVQDILCSSQGNSLDIWEDCQSGDKLITYNGSETVSVGSCEYLSVTDKTMYLKKTFDAEADNVYIKHCDDIVIGDTTFIIFNVLDVNEFDPTPVDQGQTFEIRVNEEEAPATIATVTYTDNDWGETEQLDWVMTSTQYSDKFSMEKEYDANKGMTFILKNSQPLDYEELMFYQLTFNIISTDGRKTLKSVIQTILVSLDDIGDNPPYWINYIPSYNLEECGPDTAMFKVEAKDRDVAINNDIQYSITSEDSSDQYFSVDAIDGNLKTIQNIDREKLAEQGITSFTLEITAMEYKDGEPVDPGSDLTKNTQVTIIYITDVNNKIPTFNDNTFATTIPELSTERVVLELEIFVYDMDEGENGHYTLSTDSDSLEVSPTDSRGNTTITLTAVWNHGQNFDYEQHKDSQLDFTVTAKETKNSAHRHSITISITLTDINDNTPTCTPSSFTVPEAEYSSYFITTVSATDSDVSLEYGTESIRYSLKSCPELNINDTSGSVTLVAKLDFEENPVVTCTVEARDEYGALDGNAGTCDIELLVEDVVDEPPEFTHETVSMSVVENSDQGTLLDTVEAHDKDADASISFSIDWDASEAFKDGEKVDVNLITKWFTIDTSETPSSESSYYLADIKVGENSIDREVVDSVNLKIVAVDENTKVNSKSTSAMVSITINDMNDSPPVFKDPGSNSVPENSPPGTPVLTVEASDPDVDDTITFSINDDTYMYLGDTTVVNGAFRAEILVYDTNIDRESIAEIIVTVTAKDSAGHTQLLKITITVEDLNDNKPVMEPDNCDVDVPIHVKESENNGYYVTTVRATDADKEEPHNSVSYALLNEQLSDTQNRRLPFMLDPLTGIVTVNETKGILDREEYPRWELTFYAYDACKTYDSNCKVQQSDDCLVVIIVDDINDEFPQNFDWSPKDDPDHLHATELLNEGSEVTSDGVTPYRITARDDDEPNTNNSQITFEVLRVTNVNTGEESQMFQAVSSYWDNAGETQYFCTLITTINMTGLKGLYDIEIMGIDHGTPPLNGTYNINMVITDANDHVPTFHFDTCSVDNEIPTIVMEENEVKSGDAIGCRSDTGDTVLLKISVTDEDDNENSQVTVEIDYDASTVDGATDGEGQKRSFQIKEGYGTSSSHAIYVIRVTEEIDRERGSAYNLSLHAIDNGQPQLESFTTVQVVVTNVFESPPYFCILGPCMQTLYMTENDPNVNATFLNATDEDNTNVDDPNSPNYDTVHYEIIGGNVDDFELVKNTVTELSLKNKPNGLDRESKSEYQVQIQTYNKEEDKIQSTNNTLEVTILVQDMNDNAPVFNDSMIFASFTENDNIGKPIATVEAWDRDLNETLTYSLINDFEWSDTNINSTYNFGIEKAANNTARILLNFNPLGINEGYCRFTINVLDSDNHKGNTTAKVYAITKTYELPVYFKNNYEDVISNRVQVEGIFTMAYGYQCIIDSIAQSTDDQGETTVLMHFIDTSTDTPVTVKDILDATNDGQVVTQLLKNLNNIKLDLKSIGTVIADGSDQDQKLLILQVLLGVVSLVLGSLVFLLITVYCLRTRSLERRVKVLSTNTFGSQSSDINRIGMGMAAVPGSNKFAGEGANPMYNMPETNIRNDDSSSIGSGDSVLVGVEDNPEFKNYMIRQDLDSGLDNPAFSRTIDEVSVPAGLSGGPRTNPLLQMQLGAEDHDLADGLAELDFATRHSSSGSEDTSFHENLNSNFSFGN